MISGIFIRLAQALALALIIAVIAALGVLYLPLLNESRVTLAEFVFGQLLDRKVEIAGEVGVNLAATTRISLSDVMVSNTDGAAQIDAAHVARVVFAFPLATALRGAFNLSEVSISDVDFEFGQNGRKTDTRESARVAVRFIAWLVDREQTPKLILENIVIARRNDPGGWDDTLVLKTVAAEVREKGGDAVALKAAGTFNKAVFEATADFEAIDDASAEDASRTFNASAKVPGAAATLKGRIDSEAETLDAQLEVVAKSLSKVLELVRLKPETDGSGRLAVQLKGPIDAISADGIKFEAALESGETATIGGTIADVLGAGGINLDVAVDLTQVQHDGARLSSAFDIDLRTLKCKITGGLAGLEIQNLLLSTNMASAELRDIGPISIARIVRDKGGHLGLLGLRLLEGDPAKPIFDLTGDIRDAIGMSEISFKGDFDINLVALLAKHDKSGGNMRLAGTLLISDATGRIEVNELEAKTTGEAFALTLAKRSDDAPLGIDFATKNIDALAKVMGRHPIGGGAATFKGELQVVDDLSLSGEAAIGKSKVSVLLRADVKHGQPILRGDLNAAVLRLSDIQRTAALGEIFGRKPRSLEFKETFSDGFDAELALQAKRLAGLDEAVGRLDTHLSYKQRQAVVAPLKLNLFDGTVDARLTVDNRQEVPTVALSGTVERIDVAAVLAQFEAEPLVTGKLHARFQLAGQGESAKAVARQLAGSLEVALVDAVLGNRLIDLTGQDIISWLFSGGLNAQARLNCAVAGVEFGHGTGTFHPLVIATENVQLTGQGTLNLVDDTLNIAFQPHPLHKRLVNVVTPFSVEGPLTSPKITGVGAGDIAERVVLETVTLPLRPLELLFGHRGHEKKSMNRHPCGDVPKPPSS